MNSIVQIREWPAEAIDPLITEGERDGLRFLSRLRNEWLSGTNRFSDAGEAFFGVYDQGRLVAFGGINRDSASCGRLRRFYVGKTARRHGVGRLLAQHILQFAAGHYSRVILKTDTDSGDRFFLSLGFSRVLHSDNPTHEIVLRPETPPKP